MCFQKLFLVLQRVRYYIRLTRVLNAFRHTEIRSLRSISVFADS